MWRPTSIVVYSVILALSSGRAVAAAGDRGVDPLLDPAPCAAAAAAGEVDRIIDDCGGLIDDDKTAKSDRITALIARAAAFTSKQQFDRALSDYDAALGFDPNKPEVVYARGEVWRAKGDRRRALADFAAALRLDPGHVAARASHKAMAQELERQGALMAVGSPPSVDCGAAKGPVDRAICTDFELARLDREIEAAAERLLREARKRRGGLAERRQREHAHYLRDRNDSFGRPGYDLLRAMQDRLRRLAGR